MHVAYWDHTLHHMLHVRTPPCNACCMLGPYLTLHVACWDPTLHCMFGPHLTMNACCMLGPHLTLHVACLDPTLHCMLHVWTPPYLHVASLDPTLHCMLHVWTPPYLHVACSDPPYIACCMQGPTLYCRSLLTRSALSFSTRSLVVLAGDFLDASLAALTSPSSTSTCNVQHVHRRGRVFQQAKMSCTVKLL